MEQVDTIRAYYDATPEKEWERLTLHPFEFELNRRYMDRYIHPGERVLDIGGGPGRYSLYFAERGCDVTLVDLSAASLSFAREQAAARGLSIRTHCLDARDLSALGEQKFDHVLLMGPLYHLLDEADRVRATEQSLLHVKPGDILYAAFICAFSGLLYEGRKCPEMLEQDMRLNDYVDCLFENRSFAGPAFTDAFFIQPREVLPFFRRFPLEKLHYLGSETLLAPYLDKLLSAPPKILSLWYDVAEKLAENEELFATTEHLLYIGRQI